MYVVALLRQVLDEVWQRLARIHRHRSQVLCQHRGHGTDLRAIATSAADGTRAGAVAVKGPPAAAVWGVAAKLQAVDRALTAVEKDVSVPSAVGALVGEVEGVYELCCVVDMGLFCYLL